MANATKASLEDIVNDAAKEFNLSAQAHLTLYLTARGVKPAATVSPFIPKEIRYNDGNKEPIVYDDNEILAKAGKFWKVLTNDLGLKSKIVSSGAIKRTVNGRTTKYIGFDFNTSKREGDFNRLMDSDGKDEHGSVYGYPASAVSAFNKDVGGYRWDSVHAESLLKPVLGRNPEKHLEQAYLMWVPASVNPETGEIDSESKNLCIKYREIVRHDNPYLADRLERHFINHYSKPDTGCA